MALDVHGGAVLQFVGIDVAGSKKGQAVAVLAQDLRVAHLRHGLPAEGLAEKVFTLTGPGVIVALDSPRSPAANPSGKWGRECERRLYRRGIRLQWTPPHEYFQQQGHDKEWMEIGFGLFKEFAKRKAAGEVAEVLEVFPSASYGSFAELGVTLPFNALDRKAKADQLDAVCCALVAWCYGHGHFEAVGEETEGQIVVPEFK